MSTPPHRIATLLAAALVSLAWPAGDATARDRERDADSTSVATSGDVIVHDVDRGKLAARFRGVDQKLLDGDAAAAGAELADILLGDLDRLIEERQGVYVRAAEAATLRVAMLPPEGLAAYRVIVDPVAEAALADAVAARDTRALARAVERMALSTPGPQLGVSLADLRLARGEIPLAAQALEDVLRRWPRDAAGAYATDAAGLPRAAVLARLVGAMAALGDVEGIRSLAERTRPSLLDGPAPQGTSTDDPPPSLRDAFHRATVHAAGVRAGRGLGSAPVGPQSALRVVGEAQYAEDELTIEPGRELRERPLVLFGTPRDGGEARPLLVKRHVSRSNVSLVAIAPPLPGSVGEDGDAPALTVAWRWPPARELLLRGLPERHQPFGVTRVPGTDLLVYPWPAATPREDVRRRRPEPEGSRHSLVLLDTADRPKASDERGAGEAERADGDLDLERLSFCGLPVVTSRPGRPGVDPRVFTCLVGRSPTGSATELHVACFAVTSEPEGGRLRLLWRRHVLDGSTLTDPSLSHAANSEDERPLAAATTPALRNGRLYVASGSGAVACLDAATGAPLWLETYPRRLEVVRAQVIPTSTTGWHDVPVRIDGARIHIAPRDAEGYGVYAPMPGLARSTLVEWVPVRDLGTVNEAGSLFHYLIADDLVAARDGWLYFAGPVPEQGLPSLAPTETPLVAYRSRPARDGESARSLLRAQIPEFHPAGRPAEVAGGLLIGTAKAIYQVDTANFDGIPAVLHRQSRSPGGPDRIGDLIPAGRWLWSVTPSRIVLLREK